MKRSDSILMITPFFSPNVGGVEIFLDSFCEYLSESGNKTYVVTYQPITNRGRGLWVEDRGCVQIHRYPWFGRDLFSKLEKLFLVNFVYVSSGLLLYAICFLLFKKDEIKCIHAHGLNAAIIAIILKWLFKKKIIVSLHTIYRLAEKPGLAKVARYILNRTDKIFALSMYGKRDLISVGINESKIEVYHYWVDAHKFVIRDKVEQRRKIGLSSDVFIGLFVGRFVQQKGIRIVLKAIEELDTGDFLFIFIGDGPERAYLEKAKRRNKSVLYLGVKNNAEIIEYYNIADILLWGSIDNTYLGRVCIEALYCGLPVVAPNRCRILNVDYSITEETLTSSVGFLVPPSPSALVQTLKTLYLQREKLECMRLDCRAFALQYYGCENAQKFLRSY